jgi:hypothetical protein
MADPKTEACGRCSMTTVVDAVDGERGENPFDGDRIELDDDQLRSVSPAAWFEGVSARLDAVADRIIYGR